MEDPVEVALRKFFPCRLGEYNVELEDGDSEAFQPIADQREVVSDDFLARYLHSWCECMCALVCRACVRAYVRACVVLARQIAQTTPLP